MNDLEVLKNWHHRRLNETIEEHDMRMDSDPPRNVLAALHQENEREEAESAMLPISRSSSNDGRENAVGTVCTTHHVGGRNAVGSASTVGGRIVSGRPQNLRIEWRQQTPACVSANYWGVGWVVMRKAQGITRIVLAKPVLEAAALSVLMRQVPGMVVVSCQQVVESRRQMICGSNNS